MGAGAEALVEVCTIEVRGRDSIARVSRCGERYNKSMRAEIGVLDFLQAAVGMHSYYTLQAGGLDEAGFTVNT